LIEEAESRNIVVSVGHIERFNPAVTELLYEIRNGVLGKPLTILSRRVGPFVPRVRDTDVIYDLGIHEIDIHLYILNNYPYQLRAHGLKNIVTTNNLYDHAWITLNYGENLSSIEVNRVTPFKLRKLYLTTREAVAVLDYIDQDLHIYRSKYDVAVRVKREEPLYIEDLLNILYFLRNKKALVDHYQAFTSMLLCEKSIESASKSRELDLEDDETYIVYRDYVVKGLSGYRSFINVLEELRDQLL